MIIWHLHYKSSVVLRTNNTSALQIRLKPHYKQNKLSDNLFSNNSCFITHYLHADQYLLIYLKVSSESWGKVRHSGLICALGLGEGLINLHEFFFSSLETQHVKISLYYCILVICALSDTVIIKCRDIDYCEAIAKLNSDNMRRHAAKRCACMI